MIETPEQKEAQRELDVIVEKFLRIHGWANGVLTQYVMVSHVSMPPDDEGQDRSDYSVAFMRGSCPDHIAEGLLKMGQEYLRVGREEAP
jgi:hypothetical protein